MVSTVSIPALLLFIAAGLFAWDAIAGKSRSSLAYALAAIAAGLLVR